MVKSGRYLKSQLSALGRALYHSLHLEWKILTVNVPAAIDNILFFISSRDYFAILRGWGSKLFFYKYITMRHPVRPALGPVHFTEEKTTAQRS